MPSPNVPAGLRHRVAGELPLTEAARQQILVEWNASGADYPRTSALHQLFEAQADRRLEAAA